MKRAQCAVCGVAFGPYERRCSGCCESCVYDAESVVFEAGIAAVYLHAFARVLSVVRCGERGILWSDTGCRLIDGHSGPHECGAVFHFGFAVPLNMHLDDIEPSLGDEVRP